MDDGLPECKICLIFNDFGNQWSSFTCFCQCQYLANAWQMRGQYFANTWPMIGYYLANAWPILGQYLVNTWSILGQCLAWGHILAILEWIHIHSCSDSIYLRRKTIKVGAHCQILSKYFVHFRVNRAWPKELKNTLLVPNLSFLRSLGRILVTWYSLVY